jgi:hypothetical protein
VGLGLLEVIFWPRECVEITFRVEIALKGKRDETTLPMEVTNDEDENDEN